MSGAARGRLARFGCALALALTLAAAAAAQAPSADELVAAGRRLYREGRVASGEPARALVQGDVPLLGTQVTCQSCHGRSGMGAIESGRVPSALAGPLLFAPDAQRRRPAYDESTLARALREGIDSAGRSLDPLMPRYPLADRDVTALAAYLRRVGAAPSPGVGPASLCLATLVAGDVAGDVERAVLDVLETFVAARNRSGPQRRRGGHAPGQPKEPFRAWSLDVWRLAGGPETWRAQLEARQRERPVFALVSGMATGPWQPIHDYCEAEQVPCLLPITDLPPADDAAVYSFYYSRGLRLEAEVIAATLVAKGLGTDVVGVVGPSAASAEAGAALAQALGRRGGSLRLLELGKEREASEALGRAAREPAHPIVLWLERDEVAQLAAELGPAAPPLFLSSTLLGGRWDELPQSIRARARLAHLTALPDEKDPALVRFRAWAGERGLTIRHERQQAQAYFACLAFAEVVKHVWLFPSRDYLVDQLDHASTLTAYLPFYLKGGITPGQRVLSRGGWVIDLSGREAPVWVVP